MSDGDHMTNPAPDALTEVKPWTCSINHGPDGEQHYANVYDGDKCLVGNLRIHHAVTVVETVNAIAAERARADKAERDAEAKVAELEAQIAAKDELLQMADRFYVGDDVWVAVRGDGRWAVWDGDNVLNKDGDWEPEPFPSNRDTEFRTRTRFSFDEAMSRARVTLAQVSK